MSEQIESICKVTLNSDENGMITLQCDKCKARFKLEGKFLNNDLDGEIFCPICGISGELINFYPEEIREAAIEVAKAHAEELIYNAFKKINSKYIKFTGSKPTVIDSNIEFKDKDINMEQVHLKCCDRDLSLPAIDLVSSYYCPYCGRIVK